MLLLNVHSIGLASIAATQFLSLVCSARTLDIGIRQNLQPRQDEDNNPDDQSWIKKWAAVGDSYAAGIGAGERISYWCSRYDLAYPNLINMDERMGTNSNRDFLFRACSGAVTGDVENQLWWFTDHSLDAITLSVGGNDVELSTVLNDCIFGWNAKFASVCDKTLIRTRQLISELPEKLDKVLSTANTKLSSNGRVYYTGYARFFDEATTQCDRVTFAYWRAAILTHQPLTSVRRRIYNTLVMQVNEQIQKAVSRAGNQAVYVEIDSFFSEYEGRFCEAGVTEPDANRDPLLFFQEHTNRVTVQALEGASVQTLEVADLVPASSWEGQIAALIHEAQEADDDLLEEIGTSAVKTLEVSDAAELVDEEPDTSDHPPVTAQSSIGYWLPDSAKWVFHPRPNGHALIANRVLEEMMKQRATVLGLSIEPDTLDSCPLDSSHPSSYPSCFNHSAESVPTNLVDPSQPDDIFTLNDLLVRMRQASCTNECSIPDGISKEYVAIYQKSDKSDCEISVALPNDVEAWSYRTLPSTGDHWQDCWDSFINITTQCVDQGPNKGWVNGPDVFEFFVSCADCQHTARC